MLLSALFLVICFTCPWLVRSAFFPAALPLAVRSPYFQCYADSRSGHKTNNQWPQYWTVKKSLGWCGFVRIDGSTFQLWGGDEGVTHNTDMTSFEVTPTRTILSIHANTTNVNVTFLSPIEPSDLVLQSLPFSYVYIDIESNDGQEHSIQLYSDITAEWISGESASKANWSTTKTGSSVFHGASRQSPLSMQEIDNLAEDATVYYAFPLTNDTTYQTGNTSARRGFESNGTLLNTEDKRFRSINDDWVVFSHAVNLNNIDYTASSVVWAIGLVRDPAIRISSTSGNNDRSSYFWTAYNTVGDAIDSFLDDFPNAKQRAIALDNKIVSDARNISDEYADLVTLAARQALAVDITVSKDSTGQWNKSDIMTFMRDMGNPSRVNPVEIIYASFPAYLYFNATWAGYLLEPLLRFQQPSQSTKNYAASDLGSSYPIAGNNNISLSGAIENSGNMLIMGWAHAKFSGDRSMILRYYDLYKTWADYIGSAILSTNFDYTDADGLVNTNLTNLAIKGIIGIKAMSEISQALGRSQDAETYSSTATLHVGEWQIAAGSTDHLLSTYGSAADPSSWSLVYNLFADKLLGTELVNSRIYSNQDTWYSREARNSGDYGIQYDSSVINSAKSHWTMFTAAASNDTTVRDTLISLVHKKAGSNDSAGVFPLTYNSSNGASISGQASPGQGAMFSLMALLLPPNISTSDAPPPGTSDKLEPSSSSPSNAGAIAGGVVGGLAVLIFIVFGFFMIRRRQRRRHGYHAPSGSEASSTSDTPFLMGLFGRRKHLKHENDSSEPVILQPFDSYGSQHSLQPLRPAQQNASVVPYRKRGQLVTGPNTTTGPTAFASTSARGSSSASRSGGSDSDNTTALQLRSEVEILRREVDEMRARGLYEPPPEYT